MSLADLSIFPATPDQIKEHRERTWEEWGRGLVREEYVKRDEAYENLPHGTDGKFVIWILSPRENASENLDFLASCETFQREGVISQQALSKHTNKPVIGYGVASVFTPPHHRGKGYARHMMRLLHYVLAGKLDQGNLLPFPIEQWGQPPTIPVGFGEGVASVLYSDIGAEFYKRCGKGWVVRQPIGTIWTVPQLSEGRGGNNNGNILTPNVHWITEQTQHDIWKEDARLIRQEINTSPTPCFSFLPDQGVANYMQVRSHFYNPERSVGGLWGAQIVTKKERAGDSGQGGRLSFATWALDPGREDPQTLLITRLRCTPEELPTLLNAAFHVARKSDHEQVEIWNLDSSLVYVGQEVLGGRTEPREDHLSSFSWYGEGPEENVVWKYNEKFCWC